MKICMFKCFLLLQCSPTSSSSLGLASQRMHHKIPHRLQNQMVMRATNCNVCLDSIHFGRQVSVCQECYATAHVKCATHLPNTCGLPVGLAEHFGQVVTHEPTDRSGDSSAPSAFQMKGWVKVQRPGKATCWDRKFMKVSSPLTLLRYTINLVFSAVEWHSNLHL